MQMISVKMKNNENIEKLVETQYSEREDGELNHIGSELEKQRKQYFRTLKESLKNKQ